MIKIEPQIKDFITKKVPVEIYHTKENGSWLWAIRVVETDFWLDAYPSVDKCTKYCLKHQLPYKIKDNNKPTVEGKTMLLDLAD